MLQMQTTPSGFLLPCEESKMLHRQLTVVICLLSVASVFGLLFVHHEASGSYEILPASLFDHLSMGQTNIPPTQSPHSALVRALMPQLGRVTIACVSSSIKCAVSRGSHMQQDMVMSLACSTPERTSSLVRPGYRLKPGSKNMEDSFSWDTVVLTCSCFKSCTKPHRATSEGSRALFCM